MLSRLRSLPRWQRTLWITFFAQVCSAVGFSIIFPFLPLYVNDLGTNTNLSLEFWAGMVFSAQALTMMIASPIWGALADRYGRKLMLQRAMFGGMILLAMMAFVRSAEELVLIRAIQGAITGTVSAANALVAADAPRDKTGYAMGTIQVSLWTGVALGPLIGGLLADAFGFRVPFLVTGALLGLAGLLITFGIEENATPETRTANRSKTFVAEWRHILGMTGVMQTYVIRFLSGLSRSMIIPVTPLFVALLLAGGTYSIVPPGVFGDLTVSGGRASTITGLVVGIASATTTFSAVYLGRLGDRIGHRRILIGSAIAAIVCYLPQPFVTSAWQLVVLQGFTGLAMGGIVAAPSALLARYTDPGEEGAVYGLDNSVVAGARALAPLAGTGIAFYFGLRATFAAMGLVFLAVLVVTLILLPRSQDPRPAPQPERSQSQSGKRQPQPSGAD
jgi:DHA1 family multidrug resistance protein-like MFS transporter